MTPYGIDKDLGGDSKENDSWMEACVTRVMKKHGVDKTSAIKICKTSFKNMKRNSKKKE